MLNKVKKINSWIGPFVQIQNWIKQTNMGWQHNLLDGEDKYAVIELIVCLQNKYIIRIE